MQIYLPIAEIAVSAEAIFFVSAFVGVLSGVFGIGGGFLTTPFLIFMGVPPAVAVGTQAAQIAANSVSGFLGHFRRGFVDFRMAGIMMLGSIGGSVLGMIIFKILSLLGQIDFAISFIYAVLLISIGVMMLMESSIAAFLKKKRLRKEFNKFRLPSLVHRMPVKMRFPRSKLYISALVPGAVGFISGMIAAILGIGGGFLIVPAMIYIIGMPSVVVAGTSLLQIVFTTSFAVMLHAMANNTVDILLALILIAGGVIGAQIGVAFARRLKAVHARMALAAIVLTVGFFLSLDLVREPADLFSTVMK